MSVLAFAVMWGSWAIAYAAVENDYIIPSFSDTFVSLVGCFADKFFWAAFWRTVLRTLAAFLISFALAAPLAVLSRFFAPVSAFLKPLVSVLRTLPTLAAALLLIIWTNAQVAPVIVTVLVLFPLIYARFNAAFKGIDGGLFEMAKVFRLSAKKKIFSIYLPLVAPEIIHETGADLSLGLKVTVSAEVLAATYVSLGGLMQSARSFLEMPRLAALTLITVLAGLVIDVAFSCLSRLTDRWKGGNGGD